jgi:hypothetical protein
MMRLALPVLLICTATACTDPTAPPSALPGEAKSLPAIDVNAMQEVNAAVREEIDVLVRSAFWDSDRIRDIVCQELYAPGELDERAVSVAIDASIKNWKASQSLWPETTDCDRLDAAFVKLNECGIIALHNAGMTQSDGYDDFREIYEGHANQDQIIGYCYYHGQVLERVVRGGPLFFSFGPSDPQNEETEGAKIGEIVVRRLTNAGFKVEWDGAFGKRLSIPLFNWQRRNVPSAK